MRTTSQVIENSNIPAKLIRSVIRQLGGKELLSDICSCGANAGFSGFTYYSDTVDFYNRNKGEIIELLNSTYDDFGYKSITEMIKAFNCLNDITDDEIGKTLYGMKRQQDTQVANALSWYALEEVARAFCDY